MKTLLIAMMVGMIGCVEFATDEYDDLIDDFVDETEEETDDIETVSSDTVEGDASVDSETVAVCDVEDPCVWGNAAYNSGMQLCGTTTNGVAGFFYQCMDGTWFRMLCAVDTTCNNSEVSESVCK